MYNVLFLCLWSRMCCTRSPTSSSDTARVPLSWLADPRLPDWRTGTRNEGKDLTERWAANWGELRGVS